MATIIERMTGFIEGRYRDPTIGLDRFFIDELKKADEAWESSIRPDYPCSYTPKEISRRSGHASVRKQLLEVLINNDEINTGSLPIVFQSYAESAVKEKNYG